MTTAWWECRASRRCGPGTARTPCSTRSGSGPAWATRCRSWNSPPRTARASSRRCCPPSRCSSPRPGPGAASGTSTGPMLVHAEQAFELHRPLPVAGTVRTISTVTGIYDKGSGALVVTENVAVDAATGEPLVTSRSGAFIRGEGGFGGERGTDPPWQRPDREPDHQVVQQTRPEQALIYRLSGDRNPLACRPEVRRPGRLQPADPARPVHLRGHRPRPAARAVRLRPGQVPFHVRPVQPPGAARRAADGVGLAAGRQRHRAVPDHEAGRHRGDRPRPPAGARADARA